MQILSINQALSGRYVNTKTFTIDVKKSDMQYFMGYYGRAHYEDRQPGALSTLFEYIR